MNKMKRKTYVFVLLTTIIVLLIVHLYGCSSPSNSIKIGLLINSKLDSSIDIIDSINMARDEINKTQGSNGNNIEIEYIDSIEAEKSAIEAFDKLINEKKVSIILAYIDDKLQIALAQKSQDQKIPIIFLSPKSNDITSLGDYIFTIGFQDHKQGNACALFAYNDLHKNKATIVGLNNESSVQQCDEFEKSYKGLTGLIDARITYKEDTNIQQIISSIRDVKSNLLFLSVDVKTASLIIKQARAMGLMDLTIIGGDNWSGITQYCGKEILGCYYSSNFAWDSTDNDIIDFNKRFMSTYNRIPKSEEVAIGYDAVQLINAAIISEEKLDKYLIRDNLSKVSREFFSGQLKFDNDRHSVMDYCIMRFNHVNGKIVSQYYSSITIK